MHINFKAWPLAKRIARSAALRAANVAIAACAALAPCSRSLAVVYTGAGQAPWLDSERASLARCRFPATSDPNAWQAFEIDQVPGGGVEFLVESRGQRPKILASPTIDDIATPLSQADKNHLRYALGDALNFVDIGAIERIQIYRSGLDLDTGHHVNVALARILGQDGRMVGAFVIDGSYARLCPQEHEASASK
jgi:hypothetical protein